MVGLVINQYDRNSKSMVLGDHLARWMHLGEIPSELKIYYY